jgi:hypothetical protein
MFRGPRLYSPECVEGVFSAVRIQDPAWPRSYKGVAGQ